MFSRCGSLRQLLTGVTNPLTVDDERLEDLVGALVPDAGHRFVAPALDPGPDRCDEVAEGAMGPCLIHLVVSSANQRSTRLSQEL